jgi:hypothetical protein
MRLPGEAAMLAATETAEFSWGESATVTVPAVLDQAAPDALDRWGEVSRSDGPMPSPMQVREPAGWGEGTPEPGWSTSIPALRRRTDPADPAPAAAQPGRVETLRADGLRSASVRADALRADPARSPAIVPRPRPAPHNEAVPQPLVLPGLPGTPGGPSLGGSGPTGPGRNGSGPNLNRRVPGATLSALEASAPGARGPVQLNSRMEDAEQVRESLAQFESGVARALREVDRPDEGSP